MIKYCGERNDATWTKLQAAKELAQIHYADACVGASSLTPGYARGEYDMIDYVLNILRSECLVEEK